MTIEAFESQSEFIKRVIRTERLSIDSYIDNRADPDEDAGSRWWQSFLRGGTIRSSSDHPRQLTIVDAFCGCGGLSLGASLASIALGFTPNILAAIDVDPDALKVYAANLHPSIAVRANVDSLVEYQVIGNGRDATFAYAPEVLDPQLIEFSGAVDIFLAGPPCQGHSNLNNKTRRDDPRNTLYLSAVALAVALGAGAVILENVPEVRNDRGSVVESAISLLVRSGFQFVSYSVLNAHTLGTAQTRKRFFLIAVRNGMPVELSTMQGWLRKPSHPVSWAIGDLLDMPNRRRMLDEVPVLSAENQRRIDWLFDNDEYNLPNDERPDCHKTGHTYPSVYGRLHWDKPAQTITTGFMTPGRGRFIHPLRPRVLTPHEAARLQGFPDNFTFAPDDAVDLSRASLSKLIGDAVPPTLGYAAGLATMLALVEAKALVSS